MTDNQLFGKLGRWLQRLLILYVVLLGVETAAALAAIAALAGAESLEPGSGRLQAAGISLMTMAYSAYAEVGAFVVIAILFLRFLYKAVQQAKGYTTPFTYVSPGWAVGYWFIPIMNLYRPFEVVKALSKACGQQAGGDGKPAVGEQLLSAWWALFLISNGAGWVLARSDSDFSSAAGITTYAEYSIGCNLLSIVAALLFLFVIKKLVKAMGGTAAT